ncbi:MAG: hypothetical protein JWM46_538 [Candidatus Kaiserbacteria bacterium]|nr:hypothetical protein [Candidatus Kaiserbacteria bacterium]
MKVLPQQRHFLSGIISEALANDPLVSIRSMQTIIKDSTGRSISDKYVARIMNENRITLTQGLADRPRVEERIAEVRKQYQKFIKDLTTIAYKGRDIGFKDRLAAIKLVAQLEVALLRAELQTGVFENRSENEIELKEEISRISRTVTVRSAARSS